MRLASLTLAVLLAACDSQGSSGGTVYRTEGTDYATAATLLPDGALALGVLTEGVIAPADGTIGYPAVVRFDAEGDLVGAEVYRTDERSYSGVEGVAALGNGLAVAVREGGRAAVYRTDAWGRGRRPLFETDRNAWLPSDALTGVAGGFVLRVAPSAASDPHLYAFDVEGDPWWTYRLPGAQDVQSVAVAPDGDLFVVGSQTYTEAIVARLAPDGAERWRRVVGGADLRAAAGVGEGLVLAFRQYVGEFGEGPEDGRDVEVRLVRLDGTGEAVWDRAVVTAPAAEGGVLTTALAGLADGRIALGLTRGRTLGVGAGGARAAVYVLAAGGAEDQAVAVGPPDRTTTVTHLLAAPDGRLTVVSSVGPAQLGEYGGDDLDIVVSSFTPGSGGP